MNQARRINPTRWILIGAGLLFLVFTLIPRPSSIQNLEISQVIQMAESGEVAEIVVRGDRLTVTNTAGETFSSRKETSVSVLELLDQRGIATGAEGIQIEVQGEGTSFFGVILSFEGALGGLAEDIPCAAGFIVDDVVDIGPEGELLAVQVGVEYTSSSYISRLLDGTTIQGREGPWSEEDH